MYLQYDIHTLHVYGVKVTVIQVLWNKKNRPQPSTHHDCPFFLVWSISNSAVISANLKLRFMMHWKVGLTLEQSVNFSYHAVLVQRFTAGKEEVW